MINYELPMKIQIKERTLDIRSDYRPILDICACIQDETLTDFEKSIAALQIFYKTHIIPDEQEALLKCMWFISGANNVSTTSSARTNVKLIDWSQDFPLIVAPINKLAGCDIRSLKYLHWWTFLSYFQEIGECLFSQVVAIRKKRAYNKKLQDYEKEFARENEHLIRFNNEPVLSDDLIELIRLNHKSIGGDMNGS